MTLAGKEAVRKAFENTSGMEWDSLRCELVAVRVEALFDPYEVQDLDAGGLALDLVRRSYLQGLREADQVPAAPRIAIRERERRADDYTARIMEIFVRRTNAEWVTDAERGHVRATVRTAFLAGCDEGRLPLGSVL